MSKSLPPKSPGRPPLLTPDIHKLIVDAVADGATHKLAALAAGIGERTLYDWLQRGEEGIEPYIAFSHDVKKGEGQGALKHLRNINQAGDAGTWQASAWLLERRFPHEYGKTVQEHIEKIDWESLTDVQIQRLAAGEALSKVLKG